MARGNRRETIFHDDDDRRFFLTTLSKACGMTGWRVHAWDKKSGTQAVSLEQYEENLEAIVQELKETGAKLIWASTTIVPEGEVGRVLGDDIKYNAAAAKVMQKHSIIIDDLHALSVSFKGEYSRLGNLHFDEEGSALLAQQVVSVILENLPESREGAKPRK